MITRTHFVALGLTIGTLTGCGGEEFNGSYLAKSSKDGRPILTIEDERAVYVRVDPNTFEFKDVTKFKVSYHDKKMFLDAEDGGPRFVYKRGVDRLGLECGNCEEYASAMPSAWVYSSKHIDLDASLKEQEEEARALAEAKKK